MKQVDLRIWHNDGEMAQYFFPENNYDGLVTLACQQVEEGIIARYTAKIVEGETYKVVNREDATVEQVYEDVVVARKMVDGILCYQFCDEHGKESTFPVSEWKLMVLGWKEV